MKQTIKNNKKMNLVNNSKLFFKNFELFNINYIYIKKNLKPAPLIIDVGYKQLFKKDVIILNFKKDLDKEFQWSLQLHKNKHLNIFTLNELLKFFNLDYLKNIKKFTTLYAYLISSIKKFTKILRHWLRIFVFLHPYIYQQYFKFYFNNINKELITNFIYIFYIIIIKNYIKMCKYYYKKYKHPLAWNYKYIWKCYRRVKRAEPTFFRSLFFIHYKVIFHIQWDDATIKWSYVNITKWAKRSITHLIDRKLYSISEQNKKWLKINNKNILDTEEELLVTGLNSSQHKAIKNKLFFICNLDHINKNYCVQTFIETIFNDEDEEEELNGMQYLYNEESMLLKVGSEKYFKLFYDFSQIHNMANPLLYLFDFNNSLINIKINMNKKISSGLQSNKKKQQNFLIWRYITRGYYNQFIFNITNTLMQQKLKLQNFNFIKYYNLFYRFKWRFFRTKYDFIATNKIENNEKLNNNIYKLLINKTINKSKKFIKKNSQFYLVAIINNNIIDLAEAEDQPFINERYGRFRLKRRYFVTQEKWMLLNNQWVNIYEILARKQGTAEWNEALEWERNKYKRARTYFDDIDSTPPAITSENSRTIYTKLAEKYQAKQDEENFRYNYIYSDNIGSNAENDDEINNSSNDDS